MRSINVACPKCHKPFNVEFPGEPDHSALVDCDHCHKSVRVGTCVEELARQTASRQAAEALESQARLAEERRLEQQRKLAEAQTKVREAAPTLPPHAPSESNPTTFGAGSCPRTSRTPVTPGEDAPAYSKIRFLGSLLTFVAVFGVAIGCIVFVLGFVGLVSRHFLDSVFMVWGIAIVIQGLVIWGIAELVLAVRDIAINSYLHAAGRTASEVTR